ncbi:hypothetical protein HGO23_12785 [Xenorhabdus budapestensis]|uniref:Uncharacterized protein n=1 Tax=Xenorhabdus budapestensis TaxID=290110 RepID=A0ABX7VDA6_XENBU|nr:hypothetical protein [Xenorhabdus budapestensis]QTL38754.1 hypothetical protein HGO23_12785 [Xenorhabdus budapestensis]
MRHLGSNPYLRDELKREKAEEKAAYKDAIDEWLDRQANDRLGKLPDNTLSDEVNSLLEMAGDKRSELMNAHREWLFDVCRAAEEKMI